MRSRRRCCDKSWPFDIRLRPWPSALIKVCYHGATSPVVTCALLPTNAVESGRFQGFLLVFNPLVRLGHYGEVWDFFWKLCSPTPRSIADVDAMIDRVVIRLNGAGWMASYGVEGAGGGRFDQGAYIQAHSSTRRLLITPSARAALRLGSPPHQLRQLGDIDRNTPGFVASEGRRTIRK